MNGLLQVKPAGSNWYDQFFFSAAGFSAVVFFLEEVCDFLAGLASVFAVSAFAAGFAAGAVCAKPIPVMAKSKVAANTNFFMMLNLK
jgi:hypothetical protein